MHLLTYYEHAQRKRQNDRHDCLLYAFGFVNNNHDIYNCTNILLPTNISVLFHGSVVFTANTVLDISICLAVFVFNYFDINKVS